MVGYFVPPGIRFNDYLFSEPVPLSSWRHPKCAGIVAIVTRNLQWGPKPLQPVYFGDCTHAAFDSRRADLLVAVLPMPYSSAAQRHEVCRELMGTYHAGAVNGLLRRVEELESRQQEQNQQILSLLTFMSKLFEPLPAAPRKPIGFLAQLAPAIESES